MKVGAFLLALPTACINLNPSLTRSSPLITVTYSLFSAANSRANFSKYAGTPSSSPLPLQSYLFWFLAFTRDNKSSPSLVPFAR